MMKCNVFMTTINKIPEHAVENKEFTLAKKYMHVFLTIPEHACESLSAYNDSLLKILGTKKKLLANMFI